MINPKNEKYKNDYLNEIIKILKDNEVYRVCDLLKFKKTHKVIIELFKNDIYKDTIMRKYCQENNKKNLKNLYEIIKSYMLDNKIKIYDENYVLVHIRSGDDIGKRGLGNNVNFNYFLNTIKKYKNKKVVLVTAMHYGHSNASKKIYSGKQYVYTDNSKQKNISLINKLISKIPNEVLICSNSNTDIDLVKLTLSKNVIFSNKAGGFAKTVESLHNIYLKDKNIKIPQELFIKIE